MSNINNERLPAPNAEELHYTKKIEYVGRMYREVTPDKYNITGIQFANWVIKTFDQYYQNNNHITYGQSLKSI